MTRWDWFKHVTDNNIKNVVNLSTTVISSGFFINSATSHSLVISPMNLHRGFNTPNEHILKWWQFFVGKNPTIRAPESHIPRVAHDENSSKSICCMFWVVEPPEGPAESIMIASMMSWPRDVIIWSKKIDYYAPTTGFEFLRGSCKHSMLPWKCC